MVRYDVAVIGLGATGSAALYHLARRGVRAVGVERFTSGHDRGSSHGATRIIRLGYFEHPSYVPLLRRAYQLWRELEEESGQRLMTLTGIAEIGPPDGAVVTGTLRAARLHRLPHEVLSAPALMERIPAFRIPSSYVGMIQPDGGFLAVESAIAAQVRLAAAAGATVRNFERVLGLTPQATGVRIETDKETFDAATVVVSAGAWVKALLPDFPAPLQVTRQVQAWFAPREPALFTAERFPVFLLESRHGVHYGFPADGAQGVKVAKHHHRNESVDPETSDRIVSSDDECLIRAALADHIPAADGPLLTAKTCLYTVTPDGDFIVDRLPGAPNVIVASPCSGHGFKFAPVLGEVLADLATTGATRHDISRFRIGRFG